MIHVYFCASTSADETYAMDEFDRSTGPPVRSWMGSHRNVTTPVGKAYVEYSRSDKKQFDATYRETLDSVKVLP